jgi:glycosidase
MNTAPIAIKEVFPSGSVDHLHSLLTRLFCGTEVSYPSAPESLRIGAALPFGDVLAWLLTLVSPGDMILDPELARCARDSIPPYSARASYQLKAAHAIHSFLSILELHRCVLRSARVAPTTGLDMRLILEAVFARDHIFNLAQLQVERAHDYGEAAAERHLPGISIEFQTHPLTLERRSTHYDPRFPGDSISMQLSTSNLETLFRNKQVLLDRLAANFFSFIRDATVEAAVTADGQLAERIFQNLTQGLEPVASPVTRTTHPRIGPILHVLPRLLDLPGRASRLQYLTDCLQEIRSYGFHSLLIGCVDPQTVAAYYSRNSDGVLLCHINNHGYWSSGALGVDPLLGSADDYRNLVAEAGNLEIDFIQDYVVGTLGYPAQLPELAIGGLKKPLSCVVVGEDEVDVTDPHYFLHSPLNPSGNPPEETQDAHLYATTMSQAHLAQTFALPKLNLFRPDVRQKALMRALWQLETAGTRSFRLDMAKHIGLSELSCVIKDLRDAAMSKPTTKDGPHGEFSILLEYWSTSYRDLRFASDALGAQNERTYFFDFPLANSVQSILFRGASYIEEIDRLLSQRMKWGIHPNQLVPLFIDHDFIFRPIYNGTEHTRALVIIGYAILIMLSTNCPYVYFGAFDKRNGVPDVARYLECAALAHTDLGSRNPTECLFPVHDATSPLRPVLELLRLSRDEIDSDAFPRESIHTYGCAESLTICRTGKKRGRQCRIEATFSKYPQAELRDASATVLFRYNSEPSVIIRSYEFPA